MADEPRPQRWRDGASADLRRRRLSCRSRNLALTVHVLASVGWFGLVGSMLVLGLATFATPDAGLTRAGYAFMGVFAGRVLPPVALASVATGIVLSVGTRWGLLRHRWVAAKVGIAAAVIATGTQLTGRLIDHATVATVTGGVAPAGAGTALLVGSGVHLVMLAVATGLSVFKPGGRTRRGRATRSSRVAAPRR